MLIFSFKIFIFDILKRKEVFQNSETCSVSLGFVMLQFDWFSMKSDFALLGLKVFLHVG